MLHYYYSDKFENEFRNFLLNNKNNLIPCKEYRFSRVTCFKH